MKTSFGSELNGEISSPIKIGNIIEKSKKMTSTFEEPRSKDIHGEATGDFPDRKHTAIFGETPLKKSDITDDVLLSTFAGKKAKLFFYTQRELLLKTDGTFCYKRKNKSE